MWIQNFFKSLTATPTRRRPICRPSPGSRPSVEALEDRCLLSFLPAVSYTVGSEPNAVATGAFRGAGHPLDLAVANCGSANVSVLLGNADGTFEAAQNFALGYGPKSLAVGDFNKDGKLDIVTAGGSTVTVLLGNGNGAFQAPLNYVLPTEGGLTQSVQSLTAGDFDNDGKLDVAVATLTQASPSSLSGYVNVLTGNGVGGFATDNVYALAGSAASVAVGDFTGHGNLDLAVAEGDRNAIGVLLGNGNGTFGSETDYASGPAPNSLAVGDVNGDGNLDLITANSGGSVSVILGNGNGSFQPPLTTSLPAWSPPGYSGTSSLPLQQHAASVAVGDFDRDGKLDLAVAAWSMYQELVPVGPYSVYSPATYYRGNVNVLLGHGDGVFGDAEIIPINGRASSPNAGPVAVGDFNGDTWPDLAVGNTAVNNLCSVLRNAGDWPSTPARASSFSVSGFPSSATAGAAGSFTVTAENTNGTTATGYTGTVHFTSSDGQAGLPGDYTFQAADAGVHTFSAILKTAGTQSLTATDATSASLTGSEAGITVNPAAASRLAVSAPAGSTAGNPLSVTLTALDPYNNIATSYTGTVHFTTTDAKASLAGDYTFTAADAGLHTFTNGVTLKTAGSQTVMASDTVTRSITGSSVVAVSPAAASTMTVAGFPSPTTAGVAGSFTVTLKDLYGNIASGYTGTVHFTSSDGKASLPANYTFTAADAGAHTFSATLKTASTQVLTATDATTASLTGTDGGITVKPAAASKFLIRAPASVTAGVPFSLTITVLDAYGNVVTGYTGTIHFTSTDKTATLPANYTFTAADNGVHTFTGLVLRKKGTQKITLTDTLNGSLTGSVIENVL